MKHIIFTTINVITILLFSFSVYAQSSDGKISEQEQKEIKNFVDSFTRSYAQKLKLDEIADSFFVSNYRQRNYEPLFVEKFDKSMTNNEIRKNYFTFLDFFNLIFLTKLEEHNYDLKNLANSFGSDSKDFEEFIFSNRLKPLFEKYPKAKLFFLEENFSQIKTVEDYRAVMDDYRKIVLEAENSITAEQREKYSQFITEDKNNFFKISYSFECSKEDCEGLPEKTKMFWCESLPFYLLITRENNQLKIVKVTPPSD